MKAVIFTNGDFSDGAWREEITRNADLVIAADGGARHALSLGIRVHLLIGDMDSIDREDFDRLKSEGVKILQFPQDKDKTDLELAIDSAIQEGCNQIHILAGEGGRFDHVIGNTLLLAKKDYIGIDIWFYTQNQRSVVLNAAQNKIFTAKAGALVSVIPLSSRIENFSIKGVRWPLKSVELELGSTFTLSNQANSDSFSLDFESGTMLLIIQDLY